MNKLLTFVAEARKFCVALAAALAVLATALANGSVPNGEWLQIALAFAGALGVYATSNQEKQ